MLCELILLVAAIRIDVQKSRQSFVVYCAFRVVWLYSKLWQGVRPRGPDPLPRTGSVIVISNHTCPSDPFFIQTASRRVISFLMAREYSNLRLMQPLYRANQTILVNRTGRDVAATKAALRALNSGAAICIFPEGGIHLDARSLGAAKPGAALLALVSRAMVIPVFINRQVRSNRILTSIIKPQPTSIQFGAPLDLTRYYGCERDGAVLREVTSVMMHAIARLGGVAVHAEN